MISTTIDMYRATLDGIKKESTATLDRIRWNRLANEVQEVWLREKFKYAETNNKRIDDIRLLKVATDGVNGNPNPLLPVATNQFNMPVNLTVGGYHYPEYMKFANVSFKVTYINNPCNTGTSDWLYADIMRSDSRTVNFKNPYRKPKTENLYYELSGNKINLLIDSYSVGHSMRLEYWRQPVRIFLDSDTNGALLPDAPNPSYTDHVGSVNCEFTEFQRQEIVDLAVQTFLERVVDPRYQSFLIEEQQKNQSK